MHKNPFGVRGGRDRGNVSIKTSRFPRRAVPVRTERDFGPAAEIVGNAPQGVPAKWECERFESCRQYPVRLCRAVHVSVTDRRRARKVSYESLPCCTPVESHDIPAWDRKSGPTRSERPWNRGNPGRNVRYGTAQTRIIRSSTNLRIVRANVTLMSIFFLWLHCSASSSLFVLVFLLNPT